MRKPKRFAFTLGSVLLSIVLVLSNIAFSVANAQVLDLEAPQIEHDVTATGRAGEVQIFQATVWDNQSLKTVTLFYRFAGLQKFSELVMLPADKDSYAVSVVTEPGVATAIEYYIEAVDAGGTSVARGLSFNPLMREIIVPTYTVRAAGSTMIEEPVSAATPSSGGTPSSDAEVSPAPNKPKSKTLWYALGAALLVGVAVGLNNRDPENEPVPCPESACTVTFNLTSP